MRTDPDTLLRWYQEAKTSRVPFEPMYQRAALYFDHAGLNNWQSAGGTATEIGGAGAAHQRYALFDNGTLIAKRRFKQIMNYLITPGGMFWHGLEPTDDKLKEKQAVKRYFEAVTKCLFKYRYNPMSRFTQMQPAIFGNIADYGFAARYVGRSRIDRSRLAYIACHSSSIYILLDDEGNLSAVFRRMHLTAHQAKGLFGDDLSEKIRQELGRPVPTPNKTFEVAHIVARRSDWEPSSILLNRFPWFEAYVSVEDKAFVGEQGGYDTMPFQIPAYDRAAGQVYPMSPAMEALGPAGTVNALKKSTVKVANRAGDPVLLARDDGVLTGRVDLRPGHVNYGGVNAQGQKMIQELEIGRIDVPIEVIQGEKADIQASFLADLFQLIMDEPSLTPAQLVERLQVKMIMLEPVMQSVQGDDIGPLIERELEVLARMRVLPEMPPELKEAQGEYKVKHTSPMSRLREIGSVAGFMRLTEFAGAASQMVGNSKPINRLNFDRAIPEMAEIQSVPQHWLSTDDEIEAINEQSEQQAKAGMIKDVAPALAGMAKASAAAG